MLENFFFWLFILKQIIRKKSSLFFFLKKRKLLETRVTRTKFTTGSMFRSELKNPSQIKGAN